ncbi:MAG: transposase [Planctomycetota bacterium]|nr:transposase [Planctomycetota bacterium]
MAVLHALRCKREQAVQESANETDSTRRDALKETAHKRFFGEYDAYLDSHTDIDWLRKPEIAGLIRQNLYHHHESKYYLVAYCIMPNHVHVLLQPADSLDERRDKDGPLSDIMHSLKSYTANQANRILGRESTFWQAESYDHWVRGRDELGRIVEYVAQNPVKANLVSEPHEWFFCSAHDRYLMDGVKTGVLIYPE